MTLKYRTKIFSNKVACRIGKGSFTASNGVIYANGAVIKFERDEEINIEISLKG